MKEHLHSRSIETVLTRDSLPIVLLAEELCTSRLGSGVVDIPESGTNLVTLRYWLVSWSSLRCSSIPYTLSGLEMNLYERYTLASAS